MQEPGLCSGGRGASAHSQALLGGICMGFGWGLMERSQVFPSASLQPPRAKLWLCSRAAERAETGFSFAGAGGEGLRLHRAWAQALYFTPASHPGAAGAQVCVLGWLEPFPQRKRCGSIRPIPATAPCSAEMAHPIPGKPGCLVSACHLLPARSLPGSCLSLPSIPVVSRAD